MLHINISREALITIILILMTYMLQLSKLPLHMFISRQICFVAFSQLLNGPMLYLPSPLVFVFCPAIHGLCTWFLQKMEREKYNEKYIYQHHFWCSSNMLRHPKPITGLQTHTGYNSRNTMLTNSVKSIKYISTVHISTW